MKPTFLTLSFLAVCGTAAMAQIQPVDVNVNLRRYLEFDGQLYTMDLQGLRSMSHDFREYEPELYPIVNAEYERWRKRRDANLALGIIGLGGGTILMYAGLNNLTDLDSSSDGTGALVASGVFYVVGLIAAVASRPQEQHFLNFINQVNRASTGAKLRLTFSGDAVPGGVAAGLSLRYWF